MFYSAGQHQFSQANVRIKFIVKLVLPPMSKIYLANDNFKSAGSFSKGRKYIEYCGTVYTVSFM